MANLSSIGPYRVERELGRGAMGVVYLATDSRLGRAVAVKSLPAEVADDPVRRARFEQEARTLAAINHPNIGAIFGIEEAGGTLYLILELAEGPTLTERLRTDPWELNDALDVCRQVALGIDAAHQRGIVHRDLKPENIKIRPDGVVKVLDFGIALACEVESTQEVTPNQATILTPASSQIRSGHIIGTPGYMSPEQARGRPVSAATDLWALGCIVYECLTRRVAFAGETLADALAATLMRDPDYSALPARTPARVLQLLRNCLQKDPENRRFGMGAASDELEQAIAELTHGVSPRVTRVPGAPTDDWPANPGNLAAPSGVLIGRDDEIAECQRMLGSTRLLTLVGPAGAGKSALAHGIAEARRSTHKAGLWRVLLPRLSDATLPGFLTASMWGVLKGPDLHAAIAGRVVARDPLLILDGCEQAPTACATLVHDLLESCPNMVVIATARTPLGLPGEGVFRVAPLNAPKPEDARTPGTKLEAARVYIDRAARVNSAFQPDANSAAAIAKACHFVGGWPLASSILGGIAGVIPPEDLLSRLEQRAFMLGASRVSDALPVDLAHQLVVDWSFDQLTPGELAIVLQASFFVGSPTLRMVVAAGGARDGLPTTDDPAGGPLTAKETRALSVLPRLEARGLLELHGAAEDPIALRVRLHDAVRLAAHQRLRDVPAAEAAVRAGAQAYFMASLERASAHWESAGGAAWRRRTEFEYPEYLHLLATNQDPAIQASIQEARTRFVRLLGLQT